ncbi:MAG TPA: permease-like cell division protein FtsX [Thermoanaerobaculia bacterium]|nr:permease-like cell division protein FtsX [Thermoanaerobaculia bacterium]
MNLFQAVRYFFREAAVNLARGWKVSLLAVFTIAVSLFLGGVFLLASRNLSGSVARWQREARVAVYLTPQTTGAELAALAKLAAAEPWVRAVHPVTPGQAQVRFRQVFPSLADLVSSGSEEPLPASLELELREEARDGRDLSAALDAWRHRPGVTLVDDDREWLAQVQAIVAVLRGVGLMLGLVLLGAAVFTIASVIRLTAFLHGEEISILRLVGATEFFIRGPFYAEGLLQGLLGGLIAGGALFGVWWGVHERAAGALVPSLLAAEFLGAEQMAWLVLLGALAGLAGAVASLRGETLRSAG